MGDSFLTAVEQVSIEDVRKWLVEGREDADNLVDLMWVVLDEIRDEEGNLEALRVSHPRVPINLLVVDIRNPKGKPEEPGVIRLVAETDIETIDLEPKDKLKLYRFLLDGSRLPLLKYYIYGDEDTIGVAVDLDKKSLSKEEFNDALMSLAFGVAYLARFKALASQIGSEAYMMLFKMAAVYAQKGRKKEEIVQAFIKSGLSKEDAESIVDMVFAQLGVSESKESRTTMGII